MRVCFSATIPLHQIIQNHTGMALFVYICAACYALKSGYNQGSLHMVYEDLRDFISALEKRGQLKRIRQEVDPELEITEITDRVSKLGGPALLFENVRGHRMPV